MFGKHLSHIHSLLTRRWRSQEYHHQHSTSSADFQCAHQHRCFTLTALRENVKPTSLRSANHVRCQRGTTRIRPPHAAMLCAVQQSVDNSCRPGPQQQTCSSGFAAEGPCADGHTDGRPTDAETMLRILCGQCQGRRLRGGVALADE